MAQYYASKSRGEGDNKFEQMVDGVSAEAGIRFDAAHLKIAIPVGEGRVEVDRVVFEPPVAVFIDGIFHSLYPETETRDRIVGYFLESQGWQVIRLDYKDLISDPVSTVKEKLGFLAGR